MEFAIPLSPVRLMLPILCMGVLTGGLMIFCYLYARTREQLYGAVALAGFWGFVFAAGESMLLITGGWLHDAGGGMQWHRIEQIAGAHFLYAIPAVLASYIGGAGRLRTANRCLMAIGVVAAVFLTVAAFAAPDRFISQTVSKQSWYFNEGDFGRGREGSLYVLRDLMLAPLAFYALAVLARELVRTRDRRLLLPPLIGLAIALFGAAEDIMNIHLGFRLGPFPRTDYSRFTLGITFFVLFVMGGAIRRFLDLSLETEEARQRAIREIDERRKAEVERESLREQLYQSQKLEAVGMLAGGIAHDFNNLLTAIIGNTTLLRTEAQQHDEASGNKECLGYADQVLAAADRAANLTRQLLMFSRRQAMHPEPGDLNDIVASMERILQRVIGEDIMLRFTPHGEPVPVMADTGQIEQVLLNLAANARDAMPTGGRLMISTGIRSVAEDDHYRSLFPTAGIYGYVSVYDSGCGMDAATRLKIFEPFYTTKEAGKGSGLGLSIVFGIVSRHNGVITVDSDPGRGARFTVFLPLHDAPVHKILRSAVPTRGGTETILLIEDDAGVRKVMRIMLQDAGYRVIETANGTQALAEFSESPRAFDLVVSDVVLPGMNGMILRHSMTAIRADVPFVFVSGYTADQIHRMGNTDEVIHFIAKPFTPESLLSKVRAALDESAAGSVGPHS